MFCGGMRDRIKILLWDGDGFLLMYKRAEKGTFKWPKNTKEAKEITIQQLEQFLRGAEIEVRKPIETINPSVRINPEKLRELLA